MVPTPVRHSPPLASAAAATRLTPFVKNGCVVVGPSFSDVLAQAGGYLYDHAFAGWDVVVVGPADPSIGHALSVLGASAMNLEAALEKEPVPAVQPWSPIPALVTSTAVVRAMHGLVRGSSTDVQVFHRALAPTGRRPTRHCVRHRSTLAAKEFKRQALRIANLAADACADAEETIRMVPVVA